MFSDQQEFELAEYVKHSSRIYYGLTTKEVRTLAYEYTVSNKIGVPANWSKVGRLPLTGCSVS
jgi:hypothetical protein